MDLRAQRANSGVAARLLVAVLVTAGLACVPAAPAVAGGTTIGTTKVSVGAYGGTGGNPSADSKVSNNHNGNESLSAADSDSGGVDGPASGTASISSTATATRVTAEGSATATQSGGDVGFTPTSLTLETTLTTAGTWVYEGAFTASSTTTEGMCISGFLSIQITKPGVATTSDIADPDCVGSPPAGTESIETYGGLDGIGEFLPAGTKIKIGASILGPSSFADGLSSASFSIEVKEKQGTVSNTAAPVLTGTGEVGSALSTSNGTWQGNPNAFTYQWSSGGVAVPGATGSSFTVRPADVGNGILCLVTASNGTTQASRSSNVVIGKGGVQSFSNTKKPTLSGKARVGQKLTASSGTWSPSPTTTTYQWLINGKPVKGATSATYKLKAKDEGKKVSFVVTVKSSGYVDGTATSKAKKVKPKKA